MLLRVSGPDPTRFMETLGQHQRFSGSDRLLGLFSQPESATAGLELHEDDIFGSESLSSPMLKNPNTNANFSASARRISDRNFGILAALPDRNPNPNPNLMPKVSISCSSSAMMIPPPAKSKPDQETVYRSSAPVSIPVVSLRGKGLELDLRGDDGDDEEMMMMLRPHEIVARREGRESSPMTTFSVLEGAGRTLKGSDLRRVRNAVFRRTGFVD